MQPSTLFPRAPWHLTGNGVVWLYSFPEAFIRQYAFLADFQKSSFKTGIGAVMLMNYETAEAGPYQELLFLPGLYKLKGQLTFSISKIYVSTEASALSGRENWGIPKELAQFRFLAFKEGTQTVEVEQNGQVFFSAQVKPWSPAFPFTTLLLPLTRIVQQQGDRFLLTQPEANGRAQLASTVQLKSDAPFFPPVHQLKPFATVSLRDFKMVFPVAEVL